MGWVGEDPTARARTLGESKDTGADAMGTWADAIEGERLEFIPHCTQDIFAWSQRLLLYFGLNTSSEGTQNQGSS